MPRVWSIFAGKQEQGFATKGRRNSNTPTISGPEIFPSPHDEGVGRGSGRGEIRSISVLTSPLPVPLPARPLRGEGEQPCNDCGRRNFFLSRRANSLTFLRGSERFDSLVSRVRLT